MSEFETRFASFLEQQKEIHKEDFHISNRSCAAGHAFPLMVSFRNTDRSYMMNIKGAPSNPNVCAEYCFYEPCQTLTEELLDVYLELAVAMRDELAEPDVEGHQYTMLGLVLCTEHLPVELEKKIRRFSKVLRYKEPQTGWSEVRLCVVDLANQKIVANKDGKALQNRIENGVEKAPRNWFAKLFGLGL